MAPTFTLNALLAVVRVSSMSFLSTDIELSDNGNDVSSAIACLGHRNSHPIF